MVGRGPSPSGPEHRYFDVYELKDCFHTGKNTIAAICYTYGESERVSLLNHYAGPGGFLFQAEMVYENEKREIICSDGTWKVIQAKSWQQDAPLISVHRGESLQYRNSVERMDMSALNRRGRIKKEVAGQPLNCYK